MVHLEVGLEKRLALLLSQCLRYLLTLLLDQGTGILERLPSVLWSRRGPLPKRLLGRGYCLLNIFLVPFGRAIHDLSGRWIAYLVRVATDGINGLAADDHLCHRYFLPPTGPSRC